MLLQFVEHRCAGLDLDRAARPPQPDIPHRDPVALLGFGEGLAGKAWRRVALSRHRGERQTDSDSEAKQHTTSPHHDLRSAGWAHQDRPDYHARQAAHLRALAESATTARLKARLIDEAEQQERLAAATDEPQ